VPWGPSQWRGAEMQIFVKLPSGFSTRSMTIVLEVDSSDTILDVKAGEVMITRHQAQQGLVMDVSIELRLGV